MNVEEILFEYDLKKAFDEAKQSVEYRWPNESFILLLKDQSCVVEGDVTKFIFTFKAFRQ